MPGPLPLQPGINGARPDLTPSLNVEYFTSACWIGKKRRNSEVFPSLLQFCRHSAFSHFLKWTFAQFGTMQHQDQQNGAHGAVRLKREGVSPCFASAERLVGCKARRVRPRAAAGRQRPPPRMTIAQAKVCDDCFSA